MNFKKLPAEKRNQLIAVIAIVVLAAGGLGFGLIRYQYQHLHQLAQDKVAAEAKFKTVQDTIKHADQVQADLTASSQQLSEMEADIASGDLYSWTINLIRAFKAGYKIDIPQVSPVAGTTDVDLLPGFPYKQARFELSGTAHFHDLGRFLANFENQYPHLRVVNLTMEPNAGTTGDDVETISFRMELVALVKNAS